MTTLWCGYSNRTLASDATYLPVNALVLMCYRFMAVKVTGYHNSTKVLLSTSESTSKVQSIIISQIQMTKRISVGFWRRLLGKWHLRMRIWSSRALSISSQLTLTLTDLFCRELDSRSLRPLYLQITLPPQRGSCRLKWTDVAMENFRPTCSLYVIKHTSLHIVL